MLACKPPDAPEGLDASLTWLLRAVDDDDATVETGLVALLAALDVTPVTDPDGDTSSFLLVDLTADDVAGLPMDPLIQPPDGDPWPRDVAASAGVVAVVPVRCALPAMASLLLRPDQDLVYVDDFDSYSRTFNSDPAPFLAAMSDPPRVRAAFDPWTDPPLTATTATSSVDPAPVFGGLADLDAYPIRHLARHLGMPSDDATAALIVVGFQPQAAWGSAGRTGLVQSYTLDVTLPHAGTMVRVAASWSEPRGIAADSAMALRGAVRKSVESTATLSAWCTTDTPLPAWP